MGQTVTKYKCKDCANYDASINRQCIAYNNECEPDEDATHCCEFIKYENQRIISYDNINKTE